MSILKHMTELNDICFFVKDFKGSLDFFTTKFGFEVIRYQPNKETANYVQFKFNNTSLTMWERDAVASVIDKKYIDGSGDGHPFMMAIKVDTVDIVNEIHDQLVHNGVTCIKEPTNYEFGSRASYYLDFENNIWEVFAWVEGGDGPGLV